MSLEDRLETTGRDLGANLDRALRRVGVFWRYRVLRKPKNDPALRSLRWVTPEEMQASTKEAFALFSNSNSFIKYMGEPRE